ncbi:MAG: response regulator transcription factor [Chloroflexi bacterium SZAS-1]|jgi:two-component system alkaline phosphatase synthesis response regulator PhoP|nr:response regulator transcription factor [Chloroflexi bacterium SZAS-1]HNP87483.1 response regulator transcription factor [Kouleothrix sp.]
MQSAAILVVDDEPPILDLIASYLRADGFVVHTAKDGPSALAQARAIRPDLIVLDVMLPGMDGLEVCRRIQQEFDVYVLMLTARTEEIDKIVGLSVGADDYLTKPFSPRELVVRVKTILRRSRTLGPRSAPAAPERPALRFDELVIDPDTREVWHHSTQIDLTPREFDLLYALAEQPGRVFNRDQLLERVWGHDFAGIDRVVDVHVGLLRRKLEIDPANPTIIQTVRGVGYKFAGRRR